MNFGWLLDPSWTDFGGQDGAKLGPSWSQIGAKNEEEGGRGGRRAGKGGGAENLQGFAGFASNLGPDKQKRPCTQVAGGDVRGGGWRIQNWKELARICNVVQSRPTPAGAPDLKVLAHKAATVP